MKTYLRSLKNTFSKFFHTSGYFRPIPATNHIGQNRSKIRKNRFFQKSIYCDITQFTNQGGGRQMNSTFETIFFEKSDFWGTMRSYDAIKLSLDSLEVFWQDSLFFFEFFIQLSIFMHGYANFVDAENSPLAPCLQGEKSHHSEKMSFFSKLEILSSWCIHGKRNILVRLVRC